MPVLLLFVWVLLNVPVLDTAGIGVHESANDCKASSPPDCPDCTTLAESTMGMMKHKSFLHTIQGFMKLLLCSLKNSLIQEIVKKLRPSVKWFFAFMLALLFLLDGP